MKNNELNRRDFIVKSTAFAATMALGNISNANMLKSSNNRKIGSLEVSAQGLGCMSMAGIYNAPLPKDEMVAVIRKAYENGITFFDTAEVYGPFLSEEFVGDALAPFRNKVNIATKFGFNYDGNRTIGKNAKPEYIKSRVEGSLKRLKTDEIDLLYLHRNDTTVPIEDIAGAVKDLIAAGKVRNFGLSEVSPETIRKAHAVQKVAALQSEYSLIERVVEHDILGICEELGISFVPWGPVGRGFLTGRFDENTKFDFRRAQVSQFTSEAIKANMAMLALVKDWAKRKDATPAQISLAWLQAQKPWIIPIPGTTNAIHLMENIGADKVKFSPKELSELNTAVSNIQIVGSRKAESVFTDL